ncbi:MAG: hypothetical protein ACXVCR_01335 [Bdellovibrio sp.]
MKWKFLLSTVSVISGIFAHAETSTPTDDLKEDYQSLKSYDSTTSKTVNGNTSLSSALSTGAVAIRPGNPPPVITEEVHEILIQINRTKEKHIKPILIFEGNKIIINDRQKLENALAHPGQTMTSVISND